MKVNPIEQMKIKVQDEVRYYRRSSEFIGFDDDNSSLKCFVTNNNVIEFEIRDYKLNINKVIDIPYELNLYEQEDYVFENIIDKYNIDMILFKAHIKECFDKYILEEHSMIIHSIYSNNIILFRMLAGINIMTYNRRIEMEMK